MPLEIKYRIDENQYSTTYRFIYYGIGGKDITKTAKIYKKFEELEGAIICYSTMRNADKSFFAVEYISFPRDRFATRDEIITWCKKALNGLKNDMLSGVWNTRMRSKLIAVLNIIVSE